MPYFHEKTIFGWVHGNLPENSRKSPGPKISFWYFGFRYFLYVWYFWFGIFGVPYQKVADCVSSGRHKPFRGPPEVPVGPGYWRSSFWPFLVVISARFEAILKPENRPQKRSDKEFLENFLVFGDRQRNIYLYPCFCFLILGKSLRTVLGECRFFNRESPPLLNPGQYWHKDAQQASRCNFEQLVRKFVRIVRKIVRIVRKIVRVCARKARTNPIIIGIGFTFLSQGQPNWHSPGL